MGTLRRITSGAVLTAASVVLILAVVQLWNYRQWDYLPLNVRSTSELDERARMIQDRVEILTRRVADMDLLVLILMATSGFYAIVFVASGYFSGLSFERQAERSVAAVEHRVGLAMGDLRELKEEMHKQQPTSGIGVAAEWIARLNAGQLDEQSRLQLMHTEAAAASIELTAGAKIVPLYQSFARLYSATDRTRARFYLTRALALAPNPEMHYDLACILARSREFGLAAGHLTAAFQQRTKVLDDRLTNDTEQGGALYELAVTPPYNNVVTDLLLNMKIGMGW